MGIDEKKKKTLFNKKHLCRLSLFAPVPVRSFRVLIFICAHQFTLKFELTRPATSFIVAVSGRFHMSFVRNLVCFLYDLPCAFIKAPCGLRQEHIHATGKVLCTAVPRGKYDTGVRGLCFVSAVT